MIMLGMSLVVSLIVCAAIFLGAWALGASEKKRWGGQTPFECGFDPSSSGRSGLSMRFFLLLILFLVFDVEIVVILPFVVWSGWFSGWLLYGLMFLFLVLLVGLIYEWRDGSLKWMK